MNPFHDFEKRIDRLLRDLFGGRTEPERGKELVEIQRLILDRVDDRVQMLPRARRVLPYDEIVVRIPVADPERRPAFELVFVTDNALQQEIVDHLRRQDVEFPPDLAVQVNLVDTDEITEPSLVFNKREAPAETAPPPQIQRVRFESATGETLEIAKARIQIGRYAEVLDDRKRLVRRNDLVLDEGTVSRAHAHIEYDPPSREFRLFDDGSSYGTSVIHAGRLVDVPKAGARGMRLESGDEIYFGQARVTFVVIE